MKMDDNEGAFCFGREIIEEINGDSDAVKDLFIKLCEFVDCFDLEELYSTPSKIFAILLTEFGYKGTRECVDWG